MSKRQVTQVGYFNNCLYGKAPPERGTFFRLQVYVHFMAVKKSIKRSGVVVYSYFKGQCIDSSLKGCTYPKLDT